MGGDVTQEPSTKVFVVSFTGENLEDDEVVQGYFENAINTWITQNNIQSGDILSVSDVFTQVEGSEKSWFINILFYKKDV